MDCLTGEWQLNFPRYSPEQLFSLVSAVEEYPVFVPGCVAARVTARGQEQGKPVWHVDNLFGIGPFRSRFASETRLDPPHGAVVTSSDGPWRSFRLEWQLREWGETGCALSCGFAIDFHSPMLTALARRVLPETVRRTVAAFEARAAHLFG